MENELNKWINRFMERCQSSDENCDCTPLDYCNVLNLSSLAEAKAIEVAGWNKYYMALTDAIDPLTTDCVSIRLIVTATALQRCTAVRAAVEGK